ncbi:MAG: tol-pal system-associated acyl-CoA thioesterase [Cohaesibacter sp.]|nr:tol-pal system-associated acyl-CoA thioesterase [Cohaesibacter sp.]
MPEQKTDEPYSWPDIAGKITEFGHVLPVRVYYEDTDFSGIVYHASFLRFIERGRSDFIRLLGIHHHELDQGGDEDRVAFAVRKMEIDFLRPARIDDLLQIETRIEALKGARMILDQRVICKDQVLFTAMVTVVIIDRDGRPKRMPDNLRKAFGA